MSLFIILILGYFLHRPTIYQQTRLFQMNYSQDDVQQKIALADQAVSVIRSENINSQLGVSKNTSLSVFKPGPLSISLSVEADDEQSLSELMDKSTSYLLSHYTLSALGQDVYSSNKPNLFLGLVIGLTVGFFVATLLSLVREYLVNF